MTLTLDRWPGPAAVAPDGGRIERGARVVWALEMGKLLRQRRVQAATAVCLAAPFLVVAAVKVQGTVPQDTLFGQWLHQSGFALPMVVLAFTGQWALPILTAIVAGDIFSAEDHFGTWKTVVTRGHTRGQIFVGKAAAALSYTTLVLTVLAASSLLAGLVLGVQPVVGLTGQLIGPSQATWLVLASWATQLAPLLGFAALAVLLSVSTRSSAAGIGGPIVIGLAMQLAAFVNLPPGLQESLLGTAFGSWHGLWAEPRFYGPLTDGIVASAGWLTAALAGAWLAFSRRTFGAW
jgi:ABC-2 type transport system permease protein